MIVVLFSNTIAKKLGIKQTITLGIFLTMVSGLTPVISNNFTVIMISRIIFGAGIGLFNSLLVTTISILFTGKQRSTMIGYQSVCEGLGGVLVTLIAGQLMRFGWHASFMAYAITIPVLIMFVLFVPTIHYPETIEDKTEEKTSVQRPTKAISKKVVGLMALVFVVLTFYMIMGIKVPTLMVNAGYGTTTDASYVIMMLGVGAMVGGLAFGRLLPILKNYVLAAGLGTLALAMLLIAVSSQTWVTVIAGFLTGFGIRLFFPWVMNQVNLTGSGNAIGTTMILVAYNLAGSLSPYTNLLIQNMFHIVNLRGIFWFSTLVFVILTVATVVILVMKNAKAKLQSSSIEFEEGAE